MKVIDVKAEDKRLAKLAGFKRKAPKKPKISAASHVLERWIDRYNDWAKELKVKATEGKKRDNLKAEVRSASR